MSETLCPDSPLNCLLIHPKFSLFNYWNFVDISEAIGAKANQPPLGLLTVAALLPAHWNVKVVDLNVRELTDEEWDNADLIGTGGMLPQQQGTLEVIKQAKKRGIYTFVGGPDPTSQPRIYRDADALVLGEGEISIPIWLEQMAQGRAQGTFAKLDEKPDITQSPVPRFELIDFKDYLHLGVQYSRGCPFNCEFCDIIELYGRKPRTKTIDQFLRELDYIRKLGYTGWIDIVDDNFIGNKRNIKTLLPQLENWCSKHNFPFFFSTEASMNLGDDIKLLAAMKKVDFRYVFIGIETPDEELLLATKKSQNTMRSMEFRVKNIYDHGISIAAGFIVGFDNEKPGVDKVMIRCIESLGIIMSMVGLLVALPKTQLTRRLKKEARLLAPDGSIIGPNSEEYEADSREIPFDIDDQTTGGLNFITTRDRMEILDEYSRVVQHIYSADSYFRRVLATTRALKIKRRHKPGSLLEIKKSIRGFFMLVVRMTRNPSTRRPFWRDFGKYIFMGPDKFEFAMNMLAGFIHFERQTKHLVEQIEKRKDGARRMKIPNSVVDQESKAS